MLTTTTLLISVVKKLSQTSYIKRIEAWLIFAMMIPFTQVILITYIEWLREKKIHEEKLQRVKQRRRNIREAKNMSWLDVANKVVKVNQSNHIVIYHHNLKCFTL